MGTNTSGKGRCAGCGVTGSEAKVKAHVTGCAEFARLYRESPQQALEPAVAYQEWVQAQGSTEVLIARENAREDRLSAHKERSRGRIENQLERWRGGRFDKARPVAVPEGGRLDQIDGIAGRVAGERAVDTG